MYPWFYPYSGYSQAMPPPPVPPAGSNAFAEAGANAAASAGRQHHVYLHGMDHFGRGRHFRRGPSRLKLFLLGGLAAFIFLKHRRNHQLRYGDEDDYDARRYFFACRRRVEDSRPGSSPPVTRNYSTDPAPAQVDHLQQEEMERRKWRGLWHRHHSAETSSSVAMNNRSDAVSKPTSDMESSERKESNAMATPESAELLTFDNTLFDRRGTAATATSRERMESEAMAFAEEKIDALVHMLEGLKAKLNAKKE